MCKIVSQKWWAFSMNFIWKQKTLNKPTSRDERKQLLTFHEHMGLSPPPVFGGVCDAQMGLPPVFGGVCDMGLPPVFGGVCDAHLFSFLCCVCPRPVFCVSNIASVSWLRLLFFSQKNLKIPKAKRKRANNVLQNITEKTKDRATRTDINRKLKIGKLKHLYCRKVYFLSGPHCKFRGVGQGICDILYFKLNGIYVINKITKLRII